MSSLVTPPYEQHLLKNVLLEAVYRLTPTFSLNYYRWASIPVSPLTAFVKSPGTSVMPNSKSLALFLA